ncbi:MAG TPA: NB-ARC domain-containing protein [Ktedonobacteraceae bacterium]|nr:NB-ARC domain-containing protein [Ktedonobacteraceae bacterium]
MKSATTAVPNMLLSQARELRGWSQKFVAEQIGAPATCYLSRWERGHTTPSPFYREKLCRLFGKDARELGFFLSKEPLEAPSITPNTATVSQAQIASSSKVFFFETSKPLTKHVPGLAGRREIVQHLIQKLCTEQKKNILALYGLPGVGKTALAKVCIHNRAVREHFQNGILWIDVGPQAEKAALLLACGACFGLPIDNQGRSATEDEQAQAVSRAIQSQRILIVVDDIWQVEDLLPFLNMGGPHCTYLVTTRLPHIALHLADDNAFAIRELKEEMGLELLSGFVPSLIHEERQAMLALVRSVDGLPVALTLMGQYLHSYIQKGQTQRIQAVIESLLQPEGRLRFFEQQIIIDEDTDYAESPVLSLYSSIETSDYHLPPEAQQALYALAVLPAKPKSVSAKAALEIACISEEVLDLLIDVGLVEKTGSGYYTLHQIIIDYVKSKYIDREAQNRLIDYVQYYLAEHHDNDGALEREQDILFAGIEAILELQQTDKLLRVLSLFIPFLQRKGLYTTSERYLQQAYQRAVLLEKLPQMLQSLIMIICYLAKNIQKRGDLLQARALYQQGLMLVHEEEEVQSTSDLLTNLGILELEQGAYLQAEDCFQKALIGARRHNNHKLLVMLLSYLGEVTARRGNYLLAQAYFQEGLAMAHQYNYLEWISTLLTNLGQIANEQGAYIEANHYFQPGLEIARRLSYPERICTTLIAFAHLKIEQEHYMRAQAYLQEAQELVCQLDPSPFLHCKVLQAQAKLASKQGNPMQAEVYLQEGRALAYQIGYRECSSQFFLLSGIVAIELANYPQAEMSLKKGLSLAYQLGQSECISGMLIYLGLIATRQGHVQQAEMYLQEGLAVARSIGKKDFLCTALHTLGENCLLHDDKEQAELYFGEIPELASSSSHEHQAKARYGLARVAQTQGYSRSAEIWADS